MGTTNWTAWIAGRLKRPTPASDPRGSAQKQATNVVILCLDTSYAANLAHWLKSAAVPVKIAENGRQVKHLVRSGGTWVLFTDRALPPWPGLPRLASLKRSHADLRIVVIDRGDADSRYIALAAGADAVLSPPLRRGEAIRTLRP